MFTLRFASCTSSTAQAGRSDHLDSPAAEPLCQVEGIHQAVPCSVLQVLVYLAGIGNLAGAFRACLENKLAQTTPEHPVLCQKWNIPGKPKGGGGPPNPPGPPIGGPCSIGF